MMVLALGKGPADEYKDGLSHVSAQIVGNCGLFFTNSGPEEVLRYFAEYESPDFARSGFKATEGFTVPEGVLANIPFSMEPQVRQLGLQTRLRDGKVFLEKETVICKAGDVLTPEQCRLLTLFDVQMAVFKMNIHCHFTAGEFTMYHDSRLGAGADGDAEDEDDDEEDEDD
jgi:mRNA turnover protein 4